MPLFEGPECGKQQLVPLALCEWTLDTLPAPRLWQERKLKRNEYEARLDELHMELVKMQYWIKAAGKKLVVLVEGRAAAEGEAYRPSRQRANLHCIRSGRVAWKSTRP
jgi:hypothetical protein